MVSANSFLSLAFSSSSDFRRLTSGTSILLTPGIKGGVGNGVLKGRNPSFSFAEDTDDLFVGKTLLHRDVLMWLKKTLLTSRFINQRGAGQSVTSLHGGSSTYNTWMVNNSSTSYQLFSFFSSVNFGILKHHTYIPYFIE